jgi:hypothetical protein
MGTALPAAFNFIKNAIASYSKARAAADLRNPQEKALHRAGL